MAFFTQRTQAANNDAIEASNNTAFTTNPVASVGAGIVYGKSGAGGTPFWYSGFRFTGVTLPQGATVTSAKITFTSRANWSMTAGITVGIFCEDVDNSASFSDTTDVTDRALTTATTAWTAPTSGTTDVTFDSADFTSAVKEVVDRAGWAAGNALTVLFRESAGTVGESTNVYFYEDSSTKCALLTLDFSILSTDTEVTTDFASIGLGHVHTDTEVTSDSATVKATFGTQNKSSSTWTLQSKS